MSSKVTKIAQTKEDIPIEIQRLRVAAYCRVSTRHEEQYHSLEAQIAYYTNYSNAIQTGNLLRYIRMLHPASIPPTALATSSL